MRKILSNKETRKQLFAAFDAHDKNEVVPPIEVDGKQYTLQVGVGQREKN